MKELKLISGEFFDFEIPREKKYLLKYFSTDLETAFVKYYMCFGEFEYFTEHTGFFCQRRWLLLLHNRFEKIAALHQKCKIEMDLEGLEELEKKRKLKSFKEKK